MNGHRLVASLALANLLAVLPGCGSGDSGRDTAPDISADADVEAQTADAGTDGAIADLPVEDATDPGDDDAGLDAGGDVTGDAPACTSAGAWPAVDDGKTRFGLTMFHWNIQYVAGGLIGTWEGQTISICDAMLGSGHEPCKGWGDDALNDWIIRVSFQPILDLYLEHPDWRATFELPGLMVEAMTDRHPDVLAKLQCAANSGQIELVSFHWSDQLFLAFPARDLQWSIDHNRQVFEAAALPLSGVVFNQEGQSGVGKHRMMAANGYAIDVMHRNLYRYHQQGDVDDGVWPVYESQGPGAASAVKVVVSGGVDPAAGVEVDWTFFDDGEVLATPGNPYLAMLTPEPDWAEVARFEGELQEKADAGFLHTTISDYVARLDALGVAPRPLLPIGDSTWQPPSTEGISRWMGRMGTLGYSIHEDDNRIRTGNYEASTCLAAAATLLDVVAKGGADGTQARSAIEDGYLDLVRAEVSDASGINPWFGEWVYGHQFNASAMAACQSAVDSLLAILGKDTVLVDLETRTVKADGVFEPRFSLTPTAEADRPIAVAVTSNGRTVETEWSDDGRVYALKVQIGASDDPTGADRDRRTVKLSMPLTGDRLLYSPALVEDSIVDIALADYDLLAGQLYLPLANGLVGLGPDLWLIKDCRSVHLAARVGVAEDGDTIEFIDETAPAAGGIEWNFVVLKGSAAEALQLARQMNTHPNVWLAKTGAAQVASVPMKDPLLPERHAYRASR